MPFLALPIGPLELGIVLAILVVLFGASKLGDIGGSVGRAIREFRHEVKEGEQEPEEKKASADTSEEKKTSVDTSEEKKA
jgi:sec-independent protein translocase protein TatA